jgi:hypothetical protein
MGRLRYSFLRSTNDPQSLEKEIQRYRTLLGINNEPAVTRVLQGLIEEAEGRLAVLGDSTSGKPSVRAPKSYQPRR